jgi:hypothetical protein
MWIQLHEVHHHLIAEYRLEVEPGQHLDRIEVIPLYERTLSRPLVVSFGCEVASTVCHASLLSMHVYIRFKHPNKEAKSS